MSSLKDALTRDEKKQAVIDDCCEIIDQEVADKRGLSGVAVKAGYKAVKGIKPGFVRQVVHDLLPEFADALQPIYDEATRAGKPVTGFFVERRSVVAEALLGITDAKAKRSTKRIITGTYSKLRPTAKKNVESAVPRLGALVEKHVE